jgi:hypothetical protein
MSLEQKSREVALSFVNLDDVVFARELSGNGMTLLALVGRSLVGTAAIGGGLAARGAFFGAQVATKSAMAATAAARGVVPGAETAEQAMYELDRRIGMSAERASVIASRGVAIGKANDQPPTDPIVGDPWLGKRLDPGATWNSVLVDSAVDLSRLAALPLTLTTATMERAMTSEAGQRVGRKVWDSVSSLLDSTAGTSTGSEPAGRSDTRAMLLTIGATPLWLALQDAIDLGDGLSRAALGDTRRLRTVLAGLIERVEASDADGSASVPARLMAELDKRDSIDLSGLLAIGTAAVEDTASLARLAGSYSTLLAKVVGDSMRSAMDAVTVDELAAWIRIDEERRAAGTSGSAKPRPAALERLEAIAATSNDTRGFFAASTADLARDMVFACSVAAVGREQALARIERLYGRDARERTADDCSLRDEILDAGRDRDRRIAALVDELIQQSRERLREARNRAAERLAMLSASSRENLVERIVPNRSVERAAILRRFVSMADTANALDGLPSDEASRARVVGAFDAWIDGPSDDAGAVAPVWPERRMKAV